MKTFGPCESKPILMSLDAFGLMEQDSDGCNRFPGLGFLSQNRRISELGGSGKAICYKPLILHIGTLRSREGGALNEISGENSFFAAKPILIIILIFDLHPFQGPVAPLSTQRYDHILEGAETGLFPEQEMSFRSLRL